MSSRKVEVVDVSCCEIVDCCRDLILLFACSVLLLLTLEGDDDGAGR